MSRRRHKRATSDDEVKLNMAAMLDMAFQLLTFFILTFKPAPVEDKIALRMPDPTPLQLRAGSKVGSDTKDKNPLEGVQLLTVSLYPDDAGRLGDMDISGQKFTISGTEKAKIGSLYAELRGRLERPGNSYDKLVLQVGSPVVYDTVMQVLHMCSQLQYHDGKQLQKLTKLTFVELPIKKPGKK